MRLQLKLHPDFSSDAVTKIEVEVARTSAAGLALTYGVRGPVRSLLLPAKAEAIRADGLWQHTCFELFLGREDGSYWEFNFAPSGQWAAYSFDGYRSGMKNLAIEPPRIELASGAEALEIRVALQLPEDMPQQVGLPAVIEEIGGRKSYWALAHPAGKADFHHPDSFACELP